MLGNVFKGHADFIKTDMRVSCFETITQTFVKQSQDQYIVSLRKEESW